ncbi:MAG: glucose-6-phosphate isomerase, partial [Microbacteriaceae bacterium]|nr:glucose-6-phosphate isomerase [Microbacteriaceae bacterium]
MSSTPPPAGDANSAGPVDPTRSQAWQSLAGMAHGFEPDLRTWFANEPDRAARLTFQAADLTVDLSKNLITTEVLGRLLQLAKDVDIAGRYQAMISGEHINVTEDRAVLHTALRRPPEGAPGGDSLEPAAGFE